MKSVKTLALSFVCIVVFLTLVFWGRGIVVFLRGVFIPKSDFTELTAELQAARIENQRLQAEVGANGVFEETSSLFHYKRAEVYSRYPFNEHSSVIINAGSADGIAAGMPVFLDGGILVGRVARVMRTESELLTVFDPSWKTSVTIGEDGVKALLVGGSPPRLELISKNASVGEGDLVSNVSPDFPLHAACGTLSAVQTNDHALWIEGNLTVPYALEDATSVLVLVNFP